MKKTFLLLIISLSTALLKAQVTTNPVFITQTGCAFEVTFDASAGSAGLKGVTSGVYVHMGVITSASTSSSDWRYVLTPWPNGSNSATANIAKNTLTYIGNNIWKMTISPDIQTYLGIPSTETIKKIALVFRNADGSRTGKTASGGDIFVDIFQTGLNMAFQKPTANISITAGTVQALKIASSVNAALKISINGTVIKSSATDSTTLTTSYTFSNAGDYTVIGSATVAGTTLHDTVQICVPQPVTNAPRPSGLQDGINYTDNTSATLIMHAPGKSNVFVIGDFNNWTQLNAYQMKRDGDYWWTTLTGLTPGKLYGFQYLVDGTLKVSDSYTELVLDPWNDQWINQHYSIYPNLPAYPVGKTEGVVATLQTAKTDYSWEVPSFTVSSRENLVIYEMLLRDFTVEKSLSAAISKLDYIKSLGVTAIELMPVQEFDGNNSWGYNPSHFFAPDKAYGSANMYKKFIDECHKRGLAVILDMVFNHATGLCPFAALYWDSGNGRPASNNPWMNPIAPHPYSVQNDFNHSSAYTRAYFKRVLQYWLTEYKVDGYRMDLTKGFTQTSSTTSTASNYDQTRIDILTDYYNAAKAVRPDVMFILEHFCTGSEETALANAGMYLWRNANNAYCQAAMGYQSSSEFNSMVTSPRQWVGYAESHDEYRNFYKVKTWGAGTLTTDSITRVARVPLTFAFNVLLPGPKMIWQFGEMGYDYNTKKPSGENDTSEKPSAWGWLNLNHRAAAGAAVAKIISLRKKYPNAFTQGSFTTQITAADWTEGRKIAITHSDLNMVALGNFSMAAITAHPGFSKTGKWYNLLTSELLNVTDMTMSINMNPGELLIYTDRNIDFTGDASNIEADEKIRIYPTVTTGNVNILTSDENNTTTIMSLQGQILLQSSNTKEINLSTWPAGIYLIHVVSGESKTLKKIIKY